MRADIHDGPEHNTLQSEVGYIDARPYCRIDENLLHRTAGPYIGSQPAVEDPEAHVRFAPDQRTNAAFPASSPWGQSTKSLRSG